MSQWPASAVSAPPPKSTVLLYSPDIYKLSEESTSTEYANSLDVPP